MSEEQNFSKNSKEVLDDKDNTSNSENINTD